MSSLIAPIDYQHIQEQSRPLSRMNMLFDHGTSLRLSGLCVYGIGIGVLARAFVVVAQSQEAYSLFWAGLGLCFLAVVLVIMSPGVRTWHHLLALALFGAALFLPTLLRSPAYPLFQDELHHVFSLELMRDLRTTQLPITSFPIAGDYPGLEFLGLGTMAATGLPVGVVVRLLPLLAHMLIPVLVYGILRSLHLADRGAACGSLIYCANTSFYFFHSIYSYETLGILIFLFIILLSTYRFTGEQTWLTFGFSVLMLLSSSAVVITHHVSGAMTVAFLLTVLITKVLAKQTYWSASGGVWFAATFWMSWLVYATDRSVRYLTFNIVDRIDTIVALLFAEQAHTRQLFWNSQLPFAEQVVAFAYPILVFGLIVLGMRSILWTLRKKGGSAKHISLMVRVLGVFGPAMWIMTGPLILTRSSELAYRAWPFLFVGIAFYGASGLMPWLTSIGRGAWVQRGAVFGIIGTLLAGGIILGDNQAGRFQPAEIHAAAGPEAITPNLIAAARWLEADAGHLHLVAGNRSSSVVFADYGKQRTNIWGNWEPFYRDSKRAQAFLDVSGIDVVVVDLRDARHLPRYESYYSSAETFDSGLAGYDVHSPFPLERLQKFDAMPGVERIYDNGDIVLYGRSRP